VFIEWQRGFVVSSLRGEKNSDELLYEYEHEDLKVVKVKMLPFRVTGKAIIAVLPLDDLVDSRQRPKTLCSATARSRVSRLTSN
jgi:hypothetical protein